VEIDLNENSQGTRVVSVLYIIYEEDIKKTNFGRCELYNPPPPDNDNENQA
jgi:hypothetical protein